MAATSLIVQHPARKALRMR